MSTRTVDAQERTVSLASHLTDSLARSFTLGIDDEGCTHHYYRPADAIAVFDGRELAHFEALDGRALREWRAFVAHERGWTSFGPVAQLGLQIDSERKEAHA